MSFKPIRLLPLLLGLGLFAEGVLAQFSVVFGDRDHLDNWIAQGNHFTPFNLPGNPENAVLVCMKDSGDYYMVSFPGGTGSQAQPNVVKVGTSLHCVASFDFSGAPLPYTGLIKGLRYLQCLADGSCSFSFPMSAPPLDRVDAGMVELPQAFAAAPAGTAGPPPPLLPLFRTVPLPPGYPPSALSGFTAGCDPANHVGFLLVEHSTGTLWAVQACNGTRSSTGIPVVSNPLQVAFTPDQSMALVTSFDGAVNFIDLASLRPVATLSTPGDHPSGIAISSDGSTAYVTSFTNSGALLTIDIASRKLTNRLPLAFYPQSVFLSPDDSLAWVTFPFSNTVTVVDTLTATVVQTLSILTPYGVAFNSTGTRAYVSSRQLGLVQAIDTANYSTIKSVPVGAGPVEILIAPDDTFGVVSNFDGSSLTVFDLTTFATSTVRLPSQPLGMAFAQ